MRGIERPLMSRKLRRYLESWIVVLFPWVLWTELPAVEVDYPFVVGEGTRWSNETCSICGGYAGGSDGICLPCSLLEVK